MATRLDQDLANFRNKSSYWEHDGAFSVELTPEADMGIVPSSAEIRGNTVHVRQGRIKQKMGAIQFHSVESPFYWGYKFIKVIRDGDGNLLWVNYDHR